MPPQDAIHALFCFANDQAKSVTAWYQGAKGGKAMLSRGLRGLAIVLFVIGGLLSQDFCTAITLQTEWSKSTKAAT